jgi:outer membrane protein assembly factor BamE
LNSRTPFRVLPALAVIAAIGLAGCETISEYIPKIDAIAVYKIDINQGNYLSQDMVDKLKVGMTKPQVKVILGTPLVTSAFRENRWDYVYEFARQGKVREHRQFTVYFDQDKLARWEGDQMPESVVELNRLASDKALQGVPSDKSWLDRLKDMFKSDK